MKQFTVDALRGLASEELALAHGIVVALFHHSPWWSRVRKSLKKDLKMFATELERRES